MSKLSSYIHLMRLHQPVGIFLLLWPCLLSLSLAGEGIPNWGMVVVFALGSILMRSAGCIINDMVDYKIDKQVQRTKFRPLVSGELEFRQARNCLIILLGLAACLLFFLKITAITIALSSMLLVIIYPFCKRFTYWPQLILGLVYNIGVLVAWAAVKEDVTIVPVLLYISCVFWTLGYDTIYAHQDLEDDMKIGVKSTAVKFQDKTPMYINWFYTITTGLYILAGKKAGLSYMFFTWSIFPIALLFWQVNTLVITDHINCRRRFKANSIVGALMFLATILPNILA